MENNVEISPRRNGKHVEVKWIKLDICYCLCKKASFIAENCKKDRQTLLS